MVDSIENNFYKIKERLQCQFLCCYPINCIDWDVIPDDISWEQQFDLINNTYKHLLNIEQPINISYQLNFLKKLIEHLERTCSEIHDSVYESYCQIQMAKCTTEKYAFKHYLLNEHRVKFSLRESKNFVTEGTTGLCSWQASIALADYLLNNPSIVGGKNILELGSGTGLCGFIIAKCCKTNRVLLTDGSIECVDLMKENLTRNVNESEDIKNAIEVEHLIWHEIDKNMKVKQLHPNVLLAADVVYDDSIFTDLTFAIDFVFDIMQNTNLMILAATERNKYTLNVFLQMLRDIKFMVEEQKVDDPKKSFLYWDRSTPVKIFLIKRDTTV